MSLCLLFDSDGTLVDSERLSNIALTLKFKELGVYLDSDELTSKYRGWKLTEILKTISNEYEITLAEDFIKSYRVIVIDLFTKELMPIKYVEEALKNLDCPKAVVSSGPLEKIKLALKICGLSEYFGDNIYISYEINIWKPDPRVYLHAAQCMGFQPENCVVIEDSLVGVEAGYKSGMRTLFFNQFNETCEFSSVVNFESMKELKNLIST